MDTIEIEEFEKLQNKLRETHEDYVKAIKPQLSLYISNYHFKKGDHMSRINETQKVVDTELNDILDYMNGLIEHSDKCFALAKSISKQNKEDN